MIPDRVPVPSADRLHASRSARPLKPLSAGSYAKWRISGNGTPLLHAHGFSRRVRAYVQVSLAWEGGGLGGEYGVEAISAFLCHAARSMVVHGMKQIEACQRHHALRAERPSRNGLKGARSDSSASGLSRDPVTHLRRGVRGIDASLDHDVADWLIGFALATAAFQYGEAESDACGPPVVLIIDPSAGVRLADQRSGQPAAQEWITMSRHEGHRVLTSPRSQAQRRRGHGRLHGQDDGHDTP